MITLKKLINKIIGRIPDERHRVSWRRKLTIDGIFWERVHYPIEEKK